jgi:hypothetical protein
MHFTLRYNFYCICRRKYFITQPLFLMHACSLGHSGPAELCLDRARAASTERQPRNCRRPATPHVTSEICSTSSSSSSSYVGHEERMSLFSYSSYCSQLAFSLNSHAIEQVHLSLSISFSHNQPKDIINLAHFVTAATTNIVLRPGKL